MEGEEERRREGREPTRKGMEPCGENLYILYTPRNQQGGTEELTNTVKEEAMKDSKEDSEKG